MSEDGEDNIKWCIQHDFVKKSYPTTFTQTQGISDGQIPNGFIGVYTPYNQTFEYIYSLAENLLFIKISLPIETQR